MVNPKRHGPIAGGRGMLATAVYTLQFDHGWHALDGFRRGRGDRAALSR